MTHKPTMRGEKIYEYEFDLAGVTDYGVSMDALLAGKESVPQQGARFDLAVEGRGKAFLSGRAASIICECVPIVALSFAYT
jgi:hypothetical protein